MRVTLDLDRLLLDGSITAEEHGRLARLGRRDTGLLLVNVLGGFGVVAVGGAAVMLVPDPVTGCIGGALLMVAGVAMRLLRRPQWGLLASFCLLVAALMLGAGIILLSQGVTGPGTTEAVPRMGLRAAFLLVAGLFAGVGVLGRSTLLAALATLMLAAALGAATGYGHASYDLEIRRPLLTVLVFSALALAAHLVASRLHGDRERLATTVARTALFLVNLGFWVGSLWGEDARAGGIVASPGVFGAAWAVALLAAAVWAARANRRWVLNLAATFGGIHFYTQWFERLGADPVTVLAAGLLTLGFAILLWRLNRRLAPDGVATAA